MFEVIATRLSLAALARSVGFHTHNRPAFRRTNQSRSVRKMPADSGRLLPEPLENRAMMAIDMPLVSVGNAGNSADRATGYGAVAEMFQIGRYEVSLGQYAAFLNAVAKSDPAGLFNPSMTTSTWVAGIARSGSPGSYTYATIGDSTKPVTYVSWFDAARFANWMSNGQPSGAQSSTTTEDGAYKLHGVTSSVAAARNTLNPNTGATPRFFIPSENQWYKAAYYSPNYFGVSGPAGYYKYANKSDGLPGNAPGNGGANYYTGVYAVTQSSAFRASQNYLTSAGSFRWNIGGNRSFYGTYDQNGNAAEWNDLSGTAATTRGVRGGAWKNFGTSMASSSRAVLDAAQENDTTGFRLASPMPTMTLTVIAGQLPENLSTAGGVLVGLLTATNTTAATATFSLSGADSSSFELRGNAIYLKAGVALNFESKPSYSVSVSLSDPALTAVTPVSVAYSLAVTNVNEAPTAVTLSNTTPSLAENTNVRARIKVADITVTDDALGSNSLTVAGADAQLFEIVGTSLFLKAGAALSAAVKPFYAVTVRAADSTIVGSSAVVANYSLLITRATSTIPGIPTNLVVIPGSRQITLRWSAPVSNGGSSITNYGIEYRTRTSSRWSAWQSWPRSASASTSVTLSGLTRGLIYGFRVRAENAIGTGGYTSPSADVSPSA
jgi:sulfatase modifying factor 1